MIGNKCFRRFIVRFSYLNDNISFVIIFKYNDLVNIDVRALVEKTNTLFEAGAAVVGVYSLKAIVFVIPASVLYMAVGMAFDFTPGLIVNAIGLFAELNITYFIGKFFCCRVFKSVNCI